MASNDRVRALAAARGGLVDAPHHPVCFRTRAREERCIVVGSHAIDFDVGPWDESLDRLAQAPFVPLDRVSLVERAQVAQSSREQLGTLDSTAYASSAILGELRDEAHRAALGHASSRDALLGADVARAALDATGPCSESDDVTTRHGAAHEFRGTLLWLDRSDGVSAEAALRLAVRDLAIEAVAEEGPVGLVSRAFERTWPPRKVSSVASAPRGGV